ncbi:hypothetical protein K8I28_14770 [bacterium]|nr:hypothetical protein [bacterium]
MRCIKHLFLLVFGISLLFFLSTSGRTVEIVNEQISVEITNQSIIIPATGIGSTIEDAFKDANGQLQRRYNMLLGETSIQGISIWFQIENKEDMYFTTEKHSFSDILGELVELDTFHTRFIANEYLVDIEGTYTREKPNSEMEIMVGHTKNTHPVPDINIREQELTILKNICRDHCLDSIYHQIVLGNDSVFSGFIEIQTVWDSMIFPGNFLVYNAAEQYYYNAAQYLGNKNNRVIEALFDERFRELRLYEPLTTLIKERHERIRTEAEKELRGENKN